MFNYVIKIVFVFLIVTSCSILTKTPGFYIGYEELSETEKNNVLLTISDENVCDIINAEIIVAIKGDQLLKCISVNEGKTIVYFWSPNCVSDVCIPLTSCQDYCHENGFDLYIVADYYDIDKIDAQNTVDHPIFIANHILYKKKYAQGLKKRFQSDLLKGQKPDKSISFHRFWVFEKDSLIATKRDLFAE